MQNVMSKINTESAGIVLSEALTLAEQHRQTQRMRVTAELVIFLVMIDSPGCPFISRACI